MPLVDYFKAVVSMPYFDEQRADLKELGFEIEWVKDCCQDIMFTHSPILSLRQRIQQGSYILFPNRIQNKKIYSGNIEPCFVKIIDEIPKDHESIALRILIPAYVKEQMIKGLSLFGITEATMFSDNLDLQCKEIINMFYQGK